MQLFHFLLRGRSSRPGAKRFAALNENDFCFCIARREEPDGGYVCAPGRIIITTSLCGARCPKKSACICARSVGKTRLHTLLFRKFRGGGICQSIYTHIYIKIVKQMPISTAIFLKRRYLIYISAQGFRVHFFFVILICGRLEAWRAENWP